MSFPQLNIHDRTYNESRRQLSLLAQAMTLDVIHRAQSSALTLALRHGTTDELARLLKSDFAESMLAKDVARIVHTPEYRVLLATAAREDLLEVALLQTLLSWAVSRASQDDKSRLLAAMFSLYGELGTNTAPEAGR